MTGLRERKKAAAVEEMGSEESFDDPRKLER